jgi:hypothetical protein
VTLRFHFMTEGKSHTCWRAQRLTAATGPAVAVVLAAVGCTSTPHTAPPFAVTATPTSTAAVTPTVAPLTLTASVSRKRPIIGTKVGILVSTRPNARITVVVHFAAGNREKTVRADATGLHTFWFQTASATPGYRVMVDVRVYAHGQKRSSRTSFTPRQRPPPAPATSPSAASPSGCYPKTSSGHCYEPGEFCPHADAGMSGVAGDGEAIICENNNGLRWEPA